MSQKIKIIFTLSVLLNVILLGMMGGGMLRMYNHMGKGDFRKEIESLPQDVQQRIDIAFRSSRQEMRSLFKESREAKEQVRNSLNAQTFNPENYKQSIERLNQIKYRMLQVQARKTGSIAAELNAAERRRFAGYLMRGGRKGQFQVEEGGRSPPPKHRSQASQQPEPRPQPAQVQDEPFDPVMLPMPEID